MKIFDTATTRDLLPFDRLIDALRDMFIKGCVVPQRHTHLIGPPDAPLGTVLIMPAWREDQYLGIKTVNVFPSNTNRQLPGLFSTYILYDATTGAPLAQIDGDEITSRRTAAASALAASYLAPANSSRLLLIGAGRVGRLIPLAYRTVLPIEEVWVWDQMHKQMERAIDDLRSQGIRAKAVTCLPDAVARADVVCCATLATTPVVAGAWLNPLSHLDLIGSFTPQMREADDACFLDAHLFVDTEEALQKSGDLLGPMSRGVLSAADVRGTLGGLCQATVTGRTASDKRTIFKSVGTALEDLAAAMLVFETGLPAREPTSPRTAPVKFEHVSSS